MLESLLIQNFQAHRKLRVDFDPGITTIVGPTDAGKSAVLRALKWVCTNQPGGGAFVSYWSDGATVKLLVDGHTITRKRSRNGDVNEYHLDGECFTGFGRNVPEPIARLLALGPICWQGQHDAPYWFGETAGEVSRQLNAIVNLGIIDKTLAGVASAVHRARTRLSIAEEELTRAKGVYDGLAWVPDFATAVGAVRAAADAATAKHARAAQAASVLASTIRHRATYRTATAAARDGDTAVQQGKAALVARQRADSLEGRLQAARQWTGAARIVVPDVSGMAAALAVWKAADPKRIYLKAIVSDIKAKERTLCLRESELAKVLAAVPKVCPVCGQSLPVTFTSKHDHR